MNAASALVRLRGVGKPVVTTADATLAFGGQRAAAAQTLRRLAAAGLLVRVRHGLWAIEAGIDPLVLPSYLTAPYPSYVSLQSALFLHGMVSQIPTVIYVATLGPTKRIRTSVGTFSLHRLAPTFFGGYDVAPDSGVPLARPEKALVDLLYLGPARSRLFAHIPEVTISKGFDRRAARAWVARIPDGSRRTSVERRLRRLLQPR